MTFEYIKGIIPKESYDYLELLINNEIVTKNQFIQILKNSFGTSKAKGIISNKTDVFRAISVLDFLKAMNDKFPNQKYLSNSIKRLTSNNGVETVNEIFSHVALNLFFKNYSVTYPLYIDKPDGYINDVNGQIPVEIKSRFPEIFEEVQDFHKKISSLFKIISGKDLFIEIHIHKLKKLNSVIIDNEVKSLKSYLKNINYEIMPEFPFIGDIKNKNHSNIKYTLSFYTKISQKNNIGWTKRQLDNCMLFTNTFKSVGDDLFYSKSSSVFLSDEVKNLLGKTVIEKCLKNIKNLPKEPRIIAIYSKHFGNEILLKFFRSIMNKYVEKKKGTCILLIDGNFNERNQNILYSSGISAGGEIMSAIKRNFLKPEIINRTV